LISDSRAAFDYLTTRKEIDSGKIGFLGHSEGADTALTIVSEDKRAAVIMLLAGVSRPVSEAVFEQEIYQRALAGNHQRGGQNENFAAGSNADQPI
jgi:predicted esterase